MCCHDTSQLDVCHLDVGHSNCIIEGSWEIERLCILHTSDLSETFAKTSHSSLNSYGNAKVPFCVLTWFQVIRLISSVFGMTSNFRQRVVQVFYLTLFMFLWLVKGICDISFVTRELLRPLLGLKSVAI